MTEPVIIVAYDAAWPACFEEARAALAGALGPLAEAIEHIGSTSIPGIGAKPILDVGVGIAAYPLPDAALAAVSALGYRYRGEHGIPRRHYFAAPPPCTHHIHILERTSAAWQNHLLFRDFLRAHPAEAQRYEALKRALAAQHHTDREAYTEGKSAFVAETLAKARAWRGA